METVLVRHFRPRPASPPMRPSGRVAIAGAVALAAAIAGVAVARGLDAGRHTPRIVTHVEVGAAAQRVSFDLLPPRWPRSAAAAVSPGSRLRWRPAHGSGYRHDAARNGRRLAAAAPASPPAGGAPESRPNAPEAAAATIPPVAVTPAGPVSPPATAPPPPPRAQVGAAAIPPPAAARIPALDELRRLKPDPKPAPLQSLILASGILTPASTQPGLAAAMPLDPGKATGRRSGPTAPAASSLRQLMPPVISPLIPPDGPPAMRTALPLDPGFAAPPPDAAVDVPPASPSVSPPAMAEAGGSLLAAAAAILPAASAAAPPRRLPVVLVQIMFGADATDLPDGARRDLDKIVQAASASDRRVQLTAYASDEADGSGAERRRTSLSRALAVREYLLKHGVAGGRLDVKALGSPTQGGAQDRVDLIVLDR